MPSSTYRIGENDVAEAEFIELAHDHQMNSRTKEKAFYFQMHKEMTPSLVRILTTALRDPDPQDEVAAVIAAYTRYMASQIFATVNMVADETQPAAKRELAQILLDGIGQELAQYLARPQKTPTSSE